MIEHSDYQKVKKHYYSHPLLVDHYHSDPQKDKNRYHSDPQIKDRKPQWLNILIIGMIKTMTLLYLHICICKSICTSVVETAGESFCWAGQRATNKKWPSLVTKDIVFVFFVFVFVFV